MALPKKIRDHLKEIETLSFLGQHGSLDELSSDRLFDQERRTNDCIETDKNSNRDLAEKIESLNSKVESCTAEEKEARQAVQKVEQELFKINEMKVHQRLQTTSALKQKVDYENRILRLSRTTVSSKDTKLLEDLRKKFTAYMELTGLKWDFNGSNEKVLNGYVFNKHNNYVHWFSLDKNKLSEKEITDALWKEIKQSCSADWSDIAK